jgi:ubiquitin thioesterase protein OTUB1
LASAWIQVHPNDYIPFISGYPDLKSYCTDNIEKANCEIDHVGAAALADVVVKPAGFGIDIMYLDRSAVDEVNHTLKIEPSDPTAPTLWLLYRP